MPLRWISFGFHNQIAELNRQNLRKISGLKLAINCCQVRRIPETSTDDGREAPFDQLRSQATGSFWILIEYRLS
jgi:hypothetical protein